MTAVSKIRSGETARPLSVIGCLTAGFEMVSRNLWLIALPVVLDLVLWLGPRLSVAPLLQGFIMILRTQPAPDPQTAHQWARVADLLQQLGENFNLISLVGTLPLLNVPSLLAQHMPGALTPLGESGKLPIGNIPALLGWVVLLALIGLVLGVLYLSILARVAATAWHGEPEHAASETSRESTWLSGVAKYFRVLAFVTGLLTLGLVFIPLWILAMGIAITIAQPLGIVVWMLGMGAVAYVALHLVFVVHGVLLGRHGLLRAIWESILLFRTQLPSVTGLLLLVTVVYKGLGYAWSLPPGNSWLLAIGILGNGCVATGLTAATFVFYRERVKYLPQIMQAK